MFSKISGSLSRQVKALELLKTLQEEEFSLLKAGDADNITAVEFSIHELLRQIAREKEQTIAFLGGGKVLDFAQMLPEEQREELEVLYKAVNDGEQACARQAHMNTKVSLSFLDQGEKLIKELMNLVVPKEPKSYGKRGAYAQNVRPSAMLLSGRL